MKEMTTLFNIVLPLLLSVFLSIFVIPHILVISYKKKLFDVPDSRKMHTAEIPRLGGVSFFPILLVSWGTSMEIRYLFYHIINLDSIPVLSKFLFLFIGLTLLYFTGIMDDLIGVCYKYKFIIQILCASFFTISGLWINSLGGLFGIYAIPIWIGAPLTILVVVYITNAINLIDGIDGLASGLSCISLVVLSCFCFYFGHTLYGILGLSISGVLIPFWFFNVYGRVEKRHKIFMGDAGSLTLGYTISFILIRLCMSSNNYAPHGMIMIAFSTLTIPILDIIRVVLSRISNGKNPFLPDKNHIHHKFLRTGMRVRWVMANILAISLFIIAFNIIYVEYLQSNITILFFLNILIWIALNMSLNYFIHRIELQQSRIVDPQKAQTNP